MIMPKTVTTQKAIQPAPPRNAGPKEPAKQPEKVNPNSQAGNKPFPEPVKAAKDPLACRFDHFPEQLLAFARKNNIEPLKWRVDHLRGEYILFSSRLQKYHIPIQ
jgi:hypothetical protein